MRVRPLALVAALGAVVVLTAGCAGGGPEATRSATRPATTAVPTLTVPTPEASEITRSTFTADGAADPAGRTPGSGALEVEVGCAGVDGSMMRWSLVAGDGTALGLSGEADCSGPATTSTLGITAAERPATVRVRLLPASGVVGGYAVVRSVGF